MTPPGTEFVLDDLQPVGLDAPGPSAAAVYDRPIGLRLLYQGPGSGEEHYLVQYPAGLRGHLHEHTFAHTMVVLEGKLDVNGRVIGPHAYAHFPAGQPMRHQTAGDQPCLFVLIFHGPFDVRVIED